MAQRAPAARRGARPRSGSTVAHEPAAASPASAPSPRTVPDARTPPRRQAAAAARLTSTTVSWSRPPAAAAPTRAGRTRRTAPVRFAPTIAGDHQQRRAARDPRGPGRRGGRRSAVGADAWRATGRGACRIGAKPRAGNVCPRGHGGARRVAVACGHGQEAVAAAPPPRLPARPPDPRAPRRGAATRGLAQRRHHLVARGPRGPALPARRLAPPRDVSPSRTCRVPSTTATPPA